MISRAEHDARVSGFEQKREKFKCEWLDHVRFLSVSPFGEQQLNRELALQGMRRADLNRAVTLDVKAEPVKEGA